MKIEGFVGWWPFSTIEYNNDFNIFFIETQRFTLLDEIIFDFAIFLNCQLIHNFQISFLQ